MPTLQINLLGDLSVVHDDVPITKQIPTKSQAILAYLATTREIHSRHALAGLFWGDRTEDKAKNSLRVAINGLRKQIPEHLDITRQSFGLKVDSNLQIDLQAVELALGLGSDGAEADAGNEMASTADTAHRLTYAAEPFSLDRIPELYRGGFLTSMSIGEAPEFEEWLDTQRSLWQQRTLKCLTKLVDAHLDDEVYDQAIAILERHLQIDPCAEDAHRRAMIAYSRKGDLQAALDQYERCKENLREQLGIEPTPETTAIFANLSSIDASPEPPLPATATQNTLIGRQKELDQLLQLLGDPFCRLVTVSGFGGIGKTKLVLALLDYLRQQAILKFLHGVVFVPLDGIDSAYSIPTAIADQLGAPLSGTRNPTDELIDMLRGKEMLLILDNFEHLIDSGVDLVTQILTQCSTVKLVVTCREWLNVAAEWRMSLDGLTYPSRWSGQSLDDVLAHPAIELFTSEAQRFHPEFQIGQDDVEPLIQLCRLVSGIPLAVMLAAAWAGNMSIKAIADAVAKNLDVLTTQLDEEMGQVTSDSQQVGHGNVYGDMPARQRSMNVVFESTWNQLLPDEQATFQTLCVFRNGFTVEAATQVCAQDGYSMHWAHMAEVLDALAGRGLVQYDEAADRYSLHQLLSQFGQDKLHAAPELRTLAEQNHSGYYCELLAELGLASRGPEQLDAFRRYRADSKNMVAAWQTAIQMKSLKPIASSVNSLGFFMHWRSTFYEGIELVGDALAMVRDLSGSCATHVDDQLKLTTLIALHCWHAHFYRLTGEVKQAEKSLMQAGELLDEEPQRSLPNNPARAFYALECGHLHINSNNAKAKHHYEESFAIYQALGRKWESALTLQALSMVSQSFGDLDSAQSYIQRSLSLRQQIGDQRGTAAGLSIASAIVRYQGNIEEAIRLARGSNTIYQSIGDRSTAAEGLENLGMTLNSIGEFEEALEMLEESISLYRSLNNPAELAKAHAHASHVSGCLGQFDRAAYHAKETLDIGHTISELRWVANAYTLMAWHAVVAERHEQAIAYADKSLDLAKRAGGHAEEDIARSVIGYGYDGLGQTVQAKKMFLVVLRIADREHDFLPLVTAVPKIALMLLAQMADAASVEPVSMKERWQRKAVVCYEVMQRWPVVGTSKLMDRPVKAPMATLMAELPSALATEAKEQASTLEIWDVIADLVKTLPEIGWDQGSLDVARLSPQSVI